MNIAITSNTSWNIHNFRLGLIRHLQSLGHTVYFVSPYDEFAILVTQKTKAQHIDLFKLDRKGKNPFTDYFLYKELKEIYTKYKIDIALHYTIKPNIYGALAANKSNVKCICNVTGLGYVFLKTSLVNNLIKRFFKFALNKSDIIVLQNDEDKELMLANNIFPEQKIKTIYGSGINSEFFVPTPVSHNEQSFIFLFIGRLLYDKGIVELFKAFSTLSKKYNQIQLHIVGEIDDENPSAVKHHELEKIITGNSNVIYYGKRTDVRQNISVADAVVLPSYREGLPKSLLEAMAMAKPIITSNAPGCSQLIHDNTNGFMCEAKSSADLMDKMERMLLLSNEQRHTMGLACRNLVLYKYDEKLIVKQYEELIMSLFS
jgi:glycosyltransferase involved in cell wall biosynthesis